MEKVLGNACSIKAVMCSWWTWGQGHSSLESMDCYCRFAVFYVLKPHDFSDET